ncbi:hypothetical protein ACEN2I_04120 [Flavobacterium sp. W22_SRS_FK3]|uniref:hypothetical protein n=1 Tax=Flavobacterium sp. W22_SRS_FK3 TaxID=3240275 RepID=UPI003F8EE516
MVEKNYDPDNENCPEKDTIENLYSEKKSDKNKNTQNVEEFIDDSPNRLPSKNNLKNSDSISDQKKSDQ